MKVLITGSRGFVGKNLISRLFYHKDIEVLEFNREDKKETLKEHCSNCDFVVHLAGVNRTQFSDDFYNVNADLTDQLTHYLKEANNNVPILLSSSIQSDLDNDYGKSKRAAEVLIEAYQNENQIPVYIYKLPNLFGKWGNPFYNSVIATWCYQITRNERITVTDRDKVLEFLYIDDLVDSIIENILDKRRHLNDPYITVKPTYKKTLGEVSELLKEFEQNRNNLYISTMNDPFKSKLYSTYLSYLPKDKFSYPLLTHSDDRGSFTELLKSECFGQVSVNIAKAYETKGGHWHHSKNEKFIVVKGKASIKFRNVFEDDVIEYIVSDEQFEVIDIPTGYTHSITNLLNEDLITIMWVNEPYNPADSDTFIERVEK